MSDEKMIREDVAQAMVAAALEKLLKEAWFLGYEHQGFVCNDVDGCARAECAMFITPEQSAALDRVKAEARREGMLRAASIAHDHRGLQPAIGWGQDEADGYENGQVDIQNCIAAAIRAEAENTNAPDR